MSTLILYADAAPSRISKTVFQATTWTFYALAIIMAISRTIFRVYTLRRIDADDCLLIVAIMSLTAAITIINVLFPALMDQNLVTLGRLVPSNGFADEMLAAMKLESAASNLTFLTIYSVKYAYLIFFRTLLRRARKMMIWWWVVFAIVTTCALTGFIFHWTICPHYTSDFLQICPVPAIAAREHVWLIVTTVTDIVSDQFIITIPFLLLWNVRIPLRAKFGIGFALCLSLFMIVIAIIRLALRDLVPDVSDTVWVYFCWSIESSTAVFMISATAFRSTFGSHQNSKANKLSSDKQTPLDSIHITSRSALVYGQTSFEGEEKIAYQVEIHSISQRNRDMF